MRRVVVRVRRPRRGIRDRLVNLFRRDKAAEFLEREIMLDKEAKPNVDAGVLCAAALVEAAV